MPHLLRRSAFVLSCLLIQAFLASTAFAVTSPIGYASTATCSTSPPPLKSGTDPGFPGQWWNPNKYGTGWDIYFSNNASQVVMFWLTYDANHQPIWLFNGGATTMDASNEFWAPLYQVNQVVGSMNTTTAQVGYISIAFVPGSTTAAAIRWRWNAVSTTQTYDECIYNFFYGTPPATTGALVFNQSFTGSWYNPNQSGWGLDINVGTYSNGTTYEIDNALIYDTAGNPVWLEGSIKNPALTTMTDQLAYFKSTYSLTTTCAKSNCTSGTNIGSVTRTFTGSQTGNATLTAAQSTGQVIAWPNATYSAGSVPIAKLSDNDVVSVDQTNCQVPAGNTCAVNVSWSSHLTTALVYKRNLTTNILSTTPLNNLANGQYTDNLPIGSDVQYEMHNGTTPTAANLMYTSAEVKVTLLPPTGPATPLSPQLAGPPVDDTASDSVGATNGKFSVDQSGNAQYEIPLYTPRGAGGLTPTLSLVYNSSYGDGLLGFGWQLHGLSSIWLCRQAPEHGDGLNSTAPLTDNPATAAYCLDGERMDLVSGTNGAQGAVYRLENDSMTEIVVESATTQDGQGQYFTVPTAFTVYGKDGTVRHYGGSTGLLRYQPGVNGGFTMAWYETTLQDANGNNVTFNYTSNALYQPVSVLVPVSIVYNGGEIDFSTIPRPAADQVTSYVGGAVINTTPVWISAITVKSNNQILRTYTPTYDTKLINPALKTITALTECGAASVCYKPTSFTWASVGSFLSGSGWQVASETDAAGTFSHAVMSSVKFADIDGDGRSDVVWLHCNADAPFLDGCNFHDFHEAFSSPTAAGGIGFTPVSVPNLGDSSSYNPGGSVPELSKWLDTSKAWQMMDFNGDGRADLLMLEPISGDGELSNCSGTPSLTNPCFRIAAWLSGGRQGSGATLTSSFTSTSKILSIAQNPQTGALGPMTFIGSVDMFVADFDGDGLPDLLTMGDNDGPEIWLLKPTGNASQPYAFRGPYAVEVNNTSGFCGFNSFLSQNLRVGDFNGDGRADVVLRQYGASGPCTVNAVAVTMADGMTSQVTGLRFVTSNTFDASIAAAKKATTNANGTSTSSTCCEYLQVMLSGGIDTSRPGNYFAFTPSPDLQWQVGSNNGNTSGTPYVGEDTSFQVADINGDGLADVMYNTSDQAYANSDQAVWVYQLNENGLYLSTPTCVVVNATNNGCVTSNGAAQTILGDYDGDGKADFWTVTSYGPTGGNVYSVYLWTGSGFATTPISTGLFSGDIGTSTTWYGYVADLDGDGYPDSLEFDPSGSTSSVWKTARVSTHHQPRNTVTSVKSGLGAVTSLTYAPLTFTSVYYREYSGYNLSSGWGSPVQDVLSPRYVVEYADSSAPTYSNSNNLSTVRYRYSGFKMQGGGRGALGFDKVYSIDAQTGIETVTTYNQSFPQTGTPRYTIAYTNGQTLDTVCDPKAGGNPDSSACMAYSTQTDIQSNQQMLSYASDTWNWHVLSQSANTANTALTSLTAPSPIFVYRAGGRAFKFDLNGALLSSQGHSFDYDTTYGNMLDSYTDDYNSTTTSGTNGLRQTATTETYLNIDTSPSSSNGYKATWHIGRLSNSTTTVIPIVNGQLDTTHQIIRSSTFDYDPSTGLLTGEHLQPGGSSDQASDKYHFHDNYGNEIETVTCSVEARCSSSSALTASAMTFETTDPNWVQRYSRSDYSATGGIYANTTYAPFWNGSSATEHATLTVNSRDAFGDPTQTTDMHGVVATHYYSALGREYFSASNTGAAAQTIYRWCAGYGSPSVSCPAGAAYRVDNVFNAGGTARAPETWTYYDVLARPMLAVKQGFAPTQYDAAQTTYDSLGRVYTKSEPYATYAPTSGLVGQAAGAAIYNTTTTYDSLGRVTLVQRPNGSTTSMSYNGLTQTVTMSPNGSNQTQTKTTVMDYLGRAATVTDSLGSTLTNQYDVSGNLTQVTRKGWDSRTAITQMGYDTLGRKTSLSDPDAGSWTYRYNALGEQVAKINSSTGSPTCTTTYYDGQGRLFSRADYKNAACSGTTDASATWIYDLAGNGLGFLAGATSNDGGTTENRNVYYDGFGRLRESDSTVGGTTYQQLSTYDQFGRPFQSLFQGTGIPQSGELYLYNVQGYAYQTQDAEYGLSGSIYQTVLVMDARGNVTQQEQANNPAMTTVRSYDPAMGWLTGISSGTVNGSVTNGAVQSLSYSYDSWGNMMSRSDASPGSAINESFGYDSLQRLSSQGGSSSASWSYDSFGNPNPASNLYGSYSSTPAGPCNAANEVATIGPDAVTGDPSGNDVRCFDSHGNVTRLLERGNVQLVKRQEAYTAYDALRTVNFASSNSLHTTAWYYGLDRQRLERQDWTNSTGSGTPTTNVFIGNAEIDNAAGSPITVKRYIGGLILSQTISGGTITATNYEYLFTDNHGSTHRIVDLNGNQESPNGAQWFTPFGIRAVPATGAPVDGYTKQNFDTTLTHHGFTGHEEMDQTVLIHMNGRIYDANQAHFEQADPFVQDASNLQAYNRYAYLMNNPLASTDPTGYWGARQQGYVRDAAAIAIAIWGGYEALEALGTSSFASATLAQQETAVTWATTTGFASGFVSSGGSLNAAVEGAFDATANVAIGGIANPYAKVGAHALEGGVMSSLQGGRFGHGFVSAGLSAVINPAIAEHVHNVVAGGIASTISGGTISAVTGGKFANGAITSAFEYSFNDLIHRLSSSQSTYLNAAEAALSDPRATAVLSTLASAEGGEYDSWNGGATLDDLSKHPSINPDTHSSAAGRYQITTATWKDEVRRLGLQDFLPHSQDLAAIDLIIGSHAWATLVNGNFWGAINIMSRRWATLPENPPSSVERPFNNFAEKYGNPPPQSWGYISSHYQSALQGAGGWYVP